MSKEEILNAISGKEIDVDRISDLQITKSALEKAHVYAKNIKEVHGSDLECYFYLVSPVDKKDRIVRDIYFPEQEVAYAGVRINEESIVKSGEYLRKKGLKILGWAHSHASFDTFHSGTDDENHIIVLNEISSDNYIEVKHEKNMFNDINTEITKDQIIIKDPSKNVELILNISGKFKGKVNSTKLNGPIKVGFAYSLVVNANKNLKPHCEVAIKEFCPLYLREKDVETFKVPIKVVDLNDYNTTSNIEEIKKEIKDNILEQHAWGLPARKYDETNYPKNDTLPTAEQLANNPGMYTEAEVRELLHQQKTNTATRIFKEIMAASAFGKIWRVIKKWTATSELKSPNDFIEEQQLINEYAQQRKENASKREERKERRKIDRESRRAKRKEKKVRKTD